MKLQNKADVADVNKRRNERQRGAAEWKYVQPPNPKESAMCTWEKIQRKKIKKQNTLAKQYTQE